MARGRVRVIPPDALDRNTPQTPGMHHAAAVTGERVGASGLWAGTVTILPGVRTGAHHHGTLESVIYVVRRGEEIAAHGVAAPSVLGCAISSLR